MTDTTKDTTKQDFDALCARLSLEAGEQQQTIHRIGFVFYQAGRKDGLIDARRVLDDVAEQAEQAFSLPLESPQISLGSLLRREDAEAASKGDEATLPGEEVLPTENSGAAP
jgi:uncharacterized protein (DUF885 family)